MPAGIRRSTSVVEVRTTRMTVRFKSPTAMAKPAAPSWTWPALRPVSSASDENSVTRAVISSAACAVCGIAGDFSRCRSLLFHSRSNRIGDIVYLDDGFADPAHGPTDAVVAALTSPR